MDYENKKCLMQFLKLKLVRKNFKNVFLFFWTPLTIQLKCDDFKTEIN